MDNMQHCAVINEPLTSNFKEPEWVGYLMAGRQDRKDCPLSYRFQTGCGAQVTPVQWGLWIRSPGTKRPQYDCDHSLASSAEIKGEYDFIESCLIKKRDNF
jgi:hypothetical protein